MALIWYTKEEYTKHDDALTAKKSGLVDAIRQKKPSQPSNQRLASGAMIRLRILQANHRENRDRYYRVGFRGYDPLEDSARAGFSPIVKGFNKLQGL